MAAAAAAIVLAPLAASAAGPASGRVAATARGHGSFTLSGARSGRLAVAATTCGAARKPPALEFIWVGGLRGLRGIPADATVAIELDLTGARFGTAGTLSAPSSRRAWLTVSAESKALGLVSWHAVSGRFTTAAHGASGSLAATLAPTAPTKGGDETITGDWTGCR